MQIPRIALLLVAFTLPLHAQSPAPTAEQLKSWLTIREQRVQLLRDECKQIDARIESRLDVLIETLSTITDSKDSKTKVARIKEDTMKALLKAIQFYDQKRGTIREELRSPKTLLTEEEKRKIIATFDEKIEKRTQQILELNKSMPTHKDYEKYQVVVSDNDRRDDTDYRRNPDYEQNRRMDSHTNTQRNAIIKQLDASIARLERQGQTMTSQLAATTDPAHQEALKVDIAKNDALIAERRSQKVELTEQSDKAQRNVSLKEAMSLDQALKKSIDDLRRDFTTLFQRYNSLLTELSALHSVEAALAAQGKQ